MMVQPFGNDRGPLSSELGMPSTGPSQGVASQRRMALREEGPCKQLAQHTALELNRGTWVEVNVAANKVVSLRTVGRDVKSVFPIIP